MNPMGTLENQRPQDVCGHWPRIESDKDAKLQNSDEKLTGFLIQPDLWRVASLALIANLEWQKTRSIFINKDLSEYDRQIVTGLKALQEEATRLLEPLNSAPPSRLTLNYNRSATFHRDKDAGFGCLFSFGSRPGYLALGEAGLVIQLRSCSGVIFSLEELHGSWLEAESERNWHLNIVYWRRGEK